MLHELFTLVQIYVHVCQANGKDDLNLSQAGWIKYFSNGWRGYGAGDVNFYILILGILEC